MIFLTEIQNSFLSALIDYGLLGIFTAIFAAVIAYMGKQFLALHKRNEERIKELETDLQKYLSEDRKAIIETLKDSNNALKECRKAIENSNIITEKILRKFDNKNY